ncbi:helix-turn-helix domain-containing protein [Sporolactobacillus sp. STSJ-5]|uniref:helix-turn-helix transcriptional regulator n=1 Tax=Sporolactobacillus sp. STSJ-5 TaxID=2965076 RepID=UPI002106106A|nr:helix-turn-helix transcriptional regulator [Sporolactobacillus sp. STSJ-5]MCQ2010583.1 helix-turn-helix domain-containing protein [Sporolactobacillus sp. STSJ-5]
MRDWLLAIRKQRNLTQSEVAERAEIARTTYAMIETGERNASVDNAKRIAESLGFDWTIFFENQCHETRNKEQEVH